MGIFGPVAQFFNTLLSTNNMGQKCNILKKLLTFPYSYFDFLYSNNKKVDNDADIEANNVSEENAIIIDFSYVCDMDYTAAKVRVLEYKG